MRMAPVLPNRRFLNFPRSVQVRRLILKAALSTLLIFCALLWVADRSWAGAPEGPDKIASLEKKQSDTETKADSAWIIVATGLVMLMVPGLALFYGGMVRRKNVLATMIQSMVALAVAGLYCVAAAYSLACAKPTLGAVSAGLIGWSENPI